LDRRINIVGKEMAEFRICILDRRRNIVGKEMAEFGICILVRRRNTGKERWQNFEFAYWIEEILWERKMAEF
jgi:hypothetical protein